MPTITITVDAGTTTATKTFTLTAAAVGRLAGWGKSVGGDPAMTNPQALERWAQWAMDMTKAHLVENERRKQAIPDFDVTP